MISLIVAAILGQDRLPTGKYVSPIGTHASVGSYPIHMVLSKDKRFAIVTTVGFREFLSTVDVTTGKVVDQYDFNAPAEGGDPKSGLYYGLAVDPVTGRIYASNGAVDTVSSFTISPEGKLTPDGTPIAFPSSKGRGAPWHPTGLALTSDGSRLVTINNQTTDLTDFKGSFSVFDPQTKAEVTHGITTGFPFDGVVVTKGPDKDKKLFLSSERDGVVEVFDLTTGQKTDSIKTGAAATCLALSPDQNTLYVSNAGSDTVTSIDTRTDKVESTVLLRPAAMRGLPGTTPLGMALSPNGKRLYVACADMNCLAVINTESSSLSGYIPTGWLPTSVLVTKKGILVAEAKGVKADNPNDKALMFPGLTKPDHYIQNIIDGSVSFFPEPSSAKLRSFTRQVLKNNLLAGRVSGETDFKNPGIKHVIYIIKENRTYDNVLGDDPKGNGDASICLFPRNVSPNLHALADRFVLLDNFHVCAEVSQDGWLWSTAGMISPYGSRNTPYNYSGRGRNYDTEGSNNNVAVDLLDIQDVARPTGGYFWDNCLAKGVSYRNYGFFSQFDDPQDKRYDKKLFGEGKATKKALAGRTSDNYRRYDNDYPDGDAYHLENFNWPAMRRGFGAGHAVSRFQAWKAEFDDFVAHDNLPQMEFVRMGNDHTQGTRKNKPTPQSAVADNDYAVAELTDAVSHSKYWQDTAIFVVEDDAQDGYDHVDAHRSPAYIISPYVKPSLVDSHFYNTDSVLRTMELILGLPPMNQYDAVAPPLDIFADHLVNAEPYTAVREDPSILCNLNGVTAYRAADSDKMLSTMEEESESDEELNDILWGSIKGVDTPRPPVINPWRAKVTGRRK